MKTNSAIYISWNDDLYALQTTEKKKCIRESVTRREKKIPVFPSWEVVIDLENCPPSDRPPTEVVRSIL